MKKIIYIIVAMMCLISCSKDEEEKDDIPTLGRVTGAVFDKQGNPRKGVTVHINGYIWDNHSNSYFSFYREEDRGQTKASFVTGSDGIYNFNNVVPGSYYYVFIGDLVYDTIGYIISLGVANSQVSVRAGETVNCDISY
jgi:hypothetical protein